MCKKNPCSNFVKCFGYIDKNAKGVAQSCTKSLGEAVKAMLYHESTTAINHLE